MYYVAYNGFLVDRQLFYERQLKCYSKYVTFYLVGNFFI